MALLTSILAGSLTLTNLTITNSSIKNENIYQSYLPQQKIQLEIFKGDHESDNYFLGFALYAKKNGTNQSIDLSWNIPTWELNIRANNTIIYTINSQQIGSIEISPVAYEAFDNSGNSIGYYRECIFTEPNSNYYSIEETLIYTMSGRDILNGISTINITADFNALYIDDSTGNEWDNSQFTFGLAFGTLRTDNMNSYFNAGIYTYNPLFTAYGITNITQNVNLVDVGTNNISYAASSSNNSTLRAYYGASYIDSSTNSAYNLYSSIQSKRLYYNEYDVDSMWYSSTYTAKNIESFDIIPNNFFYTRFYQTRRIPTNTRAFKLMINDTGTINYLCDLYQFNINIVYNQKLSGGTSGGTDQEGDITIECSGTLLTNFSCYFNNAVSNTLFQGPLFKPVVELITKLGGIIESIAGVFYKIIDVLKVDTL